MLGFAIKFLVNRGLRTLFRGLGIRKEERMYEDQLKGMWGQVMKTGTVVWAIVAAVAILGLCVVMVGTGNMDFMEAVGVAMVVIPGLLAVIRGRGGVMKAQRATETTQEMLVAMEPAKLARFKSRGGAAGRR